MSPIAISPASYYHSDVILIMTSFATEAGGMSVRAAAAGIIAADFSADSRLQRSGWQQLSGFRGRSLLICYADDTRSRNRRQKTGVGFWRRFFTPVAKFLAPETNTDE